MLPPSSGRRYRYPLSSPSSPGHSLALGSSLQESVIEDGWRGEASTVVSTDIDNCGEVSVIVVKVQDGSEMVNQRKFIILVREKNIHFALIKSPIETKVI